MMGTIWESTRRTWLLKPSKTRYYATGMHVMRKVNQVSYFRFTGLSRSLKRLILIGLVHMLTLTCRV